MKKKNHLDLFNEKEFKNIDTHRLGQIYALCYFVYPLPHFNVVLISKIILLDDSLVKQHCTGGGGKLISCSVFTNITLKSAYFARNVL